MENVKWYWCDIRLSRQKRGFSRHFTFYTLHFTFVCPDDWDDDGLPNDADPNPYVCDGDFFGPNQELPQGVNSNAYCWVDVVVSNANALVSFVGDAPSALADPCFIAKAGETNRVTVLIGKSYHVTCQMPIVCVGKSSYEIDVYQNSLTEMYICWPVTIEAVSMRSGSSFSMNVWPDCLGGGFTWTNVCCSISSSGWTFTYSCGGTCTCSGCGALGYYGYESYCLPACGGSCGCAAQPGVGDGGEEDDDGPYDAGASATFSKGAVIFEDRYENTPGVWVERQSTKTELHCVAHGGPNGGHVRFDIVGEDKLSRVAGISLPQERDVGPGKKVDFTIVYTGKLPSSSANDIMATAAFTENVTGATQEVTTARLTSVKMMLETKEEALANYCRQRRTYGVREGVNVYHTPIAAEVLIAINSTDAVIGADNEEFYCPWNGGEFQLDLSCGDALYESKFTVVEPRVFCQSACWDGVLGTLGCAGQLHMDLYLYVAPSNVSFNGIFIVEIPDDIVRPHSGYFNDSDTNKVGALSHSVAAGAGEWHQVRGNAWAIDGVGRRTIYPQPWSDGWKEWEIPVGWGDLHHTLKGQMLPNPTTQRFTLSADGTATVRKYGHIIERRINNNVYKDGVLQNP